MSFVGVFKPTAQSYRQKDKASSLILEPIKQLLQLTEWRGRHTGLMALSAVMSSVIEVSPEMVLFDIAWVPKADGKRGHSGRGR